MPATKFNYELAFSRNLGWITKEEFEKIKNFKIAIAGLGGVGGSHLIALVRMGFCKFHLADFDSYGIENFNRQMGANLQTINLKKIDVMTEQALLINPHLEIKKFSDGINSLNMSDFLEGVDFYADGLDAFVLDVRSEIFESCYEKNIPATTVAPIGMGAALINFLPTKMSFESYFGLNKKSFDEQITRFILGMAPSLIQRKSLVDKSYTRLSEKRGPSTSMGCFLSSGVLATEALKILLKRKHIKAAPWNIHFDAYTNTVKHKYMWWGHKNPIFKLKLWLFKMIYAKVIRN